MRFSNPLLLASCAVLFIASSCTLITDVDRSKIPDGTAGVTNNAAGDSNMPQGGDTSAAGSNSTGGTVPIAGSPDGGTGTMPMAGSGGVPAEAGSGGAPAAGAPADGGAAGTTMAAAGAGMGAI